ncbi:hypothetical protein CDEF62S_04538 [Castellaniella defragrans]
MRSHRFDNSNMLGWVFMAPAAILLLFFLTYPLGLGVWLGFTDTTIGSDGQWIGLGNAYLVKDPISQLALFNTILYTVVACAFKFALGLWLAILLNHKLRMQSFFRSVIMLPWIVPAAKYEKVLDKINHSQEYKDFMTKQGYGIAYASGQDFATFMAKSDADMGKIMKTLGLSKD